MAPFYWLSDIRVSDWHRRRDIQRNYDSKWIGPFGPIRFQWTANWLYCDL